MKIASSTLIQQLADQTNDIIERVQKFKALDETVLNQRLEEGSWSILECLEHLNRYGDYYIPEIGRRMKESTKPASDVFKAGGLGNYFANSMKPKEKLNKMKTFKNMNPLGSKLDRGVIEHFLKQQNQMLDLLETAKTKNLTRIKTGITISNILKLRLGDTFRVVIYHNDRHIQQAERVLKHVGRSVKSLESVHN